MTLISLLRQANLQAGVASDDASYRGGYDRERQLGLLNQEWARLSALTPRWHDLVRRKQLPIRFESIEEYVNTVPVMTKDDLRTNMEGLIDTSANISRWATSGGSQGEPTRIPVSRPELRHLDRQRWVMRSWCGLSPADSALFVWGHRHLLGAGAGRYRRDLERRVKDRALGYSRFSAYEIDRQSVKAFVRLINKRRPKYVIGYSGSLDLIAQIGAEEGLAVFSPAAVIATAESFPSDRGPENVEEFFGALCVMEYGSSETQVLAQSLDSSRDMRVLWRSYLIDLDRTRGGDTGSVRVTSLFPRALPLVRFDMGDESPVAAHQVTAGVSTLRGVQGKSNEFIDFGSGRMVHSEILRHAMAEESEVVRYQLVFGDGAPKLVVLGKRDLDLPATAERVRDNLRRLTDGPVNLEVSVRDKLLRTVAGKTPTVLDARQVSS